MKLSGTRAREHQCTDGGDEWATNSIDKTAEAPEGRVSDTSPFMGLSWLWDLVPSAFGRSNGVKSIAIVAQQPNAASSPF